MKMLTTWAFSVNPPLEYRDVNLLAGSYVSVFVNSSGVSRYSLGWYYIPMKLNEPVTHLCPVRLTWLHRTLRKHHVSVVCRCFSGANVSAQCLSFWKGKQVFLLHTTMSAGLHGSCGTIALERPICLRRALCYYECEAGALPTPVFPWGPGGAQGKQDPWASPSHNSPTQVFAELSQTSTTEAMLWIIILVPDIDIY